MPVGLPDYEAYQFDPTLVGALQAGVAGTAPSAAEQQLQAGLTQTMQRAKGLQAAQRGVNPALASMMGQATASQLGMQVGREAAGLRAQEMAQARGQALQLEQMRAQQQQAANQMALQKALADRQMMMQLIGTGLGAAGAAAGMGV